MGELRRSDIRTGEEYEGVRAESRRGVAEMQRHRRVELGELLSLVFENRESVRSIVEEVVRAERISGEEQVAREVEAFKPLVPAPGQLAAALYVEVPDPAELADRLEGLEGVERSVYVEVAGARIAGEPHELAAAEGTPPAYYVAFSLTDEQRRAWLEGERVVVGVAHPAIETRVELDGAQREALATDLRSPS